MNRRHVILGSLTAFATYALLREARAVVPLDGRMPARRWVLLQDELARGLAGGSVSQVEWHAAVNALAGEVDVASLGDAINRAQLNTAGEPFGRDPVKRFVTFLDESGAPQKLAYGAAIFQFGRESVITPHAHKNMASAHMVINGKVRIRTFDRVAEEEGALLIRPTSDLVAEPGHAAAMTTARDNVHWFASRSESATTFDVIIDGLEPGERSYVIQPVDPLQGELQADGAIRAPLLSFDESAQRFTAEM